MRLSMYFSVWCTKTRHSVPIKCPDSGIQVGSVLSKGTIYWLGLASDANFIRAVATTFDAPIFCQKKKRWFWEIPLFVEAAKRCDKYWINILVMPNYRYVKLSYNMLKILDEYGQTNWASKVKYYFQMDLDMRGRFNMFKTQNCF